MAGMKVWYDREGDYLAVTFEEMPATMEETDEDVFERRASDGRIIDFAVFNFSKHDRDKLTLPLSVTAVATE